MNSVIIILSSVIFIIGIIIFIYYALKYELKEISKDDDIGRLKRYNKKQML